MVVTLCLSAALAARLTVDAGGATDFADLASAIAAASPGDIIAVAPGTYDPVTLSGPTVPIVGLGGSALVALDASATPTLWAIEAPDGLHLEGFRLLGPGLGGVLVSGGDLVLRDVAALELITGLAMTGDGALDAQGLVIAGATTGIATSGGSARAVDGATLVDNTTHITAGSALTLRHAILDQGDVVDSSCAATVAFERSMLSDYGALRSCVQLSATMLGVDPGFALFTDNGDSSDDDLHLSGSAYGIDAGDPGCQDPDGTVCDLGAYGGPLAGRADADQDGLPDADEAALGLDASLDDGSLDDDGDGLDNLAEYLYGCDPFLFDTDSDGESDLGELENGRDPTNPDDNAPVPAIAAERATVGTPLMLDGGGSTDPTGDALTYAWVLRTTPARSALRGALGAAPQIELTPDVEGTYIITLTVSDGHQSRTATAQIYARVDNVFNVPGDANDLAELLPALTDGDVVLLGPGTHAANLSIDFDLTLHGQGDTSTVLTGDAVVLAVRGAHLTLTNLALVNEHGGRGLLARDALVQLRDVRVSTRDRAAIDVRDSALVGWRVHSTATSSYGLAAIRAAVWLVQSVIQSPNHAGLSVYSGRLDLTSSFAYARAIGVRAARSVARLDHVTAGSVEDSAIALSASDVWARDLAILDSATGISCQSLDRQDIDYILQANVDVPLDHCQQMPHELREARFDGAGGVPAEGSTAIDGGDPFEQDPDGTRSDLGWTGGALGLGYDHGAALPDTDEDGDGLIAVAEVILGSRDDRDDSDGDGVDDLAELRALYDPGDPFDHLPELDTDRWVRAGFGERLRLEPEIPPDPDGDACAFAWLDADAHDPDTSRPGKRSYPWVLRCGDGALYGKVTVLVEAPLDVPGDADDLDEALLLARDHSVIVLGPGVRSGPAQPIDRPVAILGSGLDTRIEGDLSLGHPAASLENLVLDGDLTQRGGALRTVIVWGAARLSGVSLSGVTVDGGPLDAADESDLAFFTVRGGLYASGGSLHCGTHTDAASIVSHSTVGESLLSYAPDYILADEPEHAILEPWPGSQLWRACAAAEDIGATGGRFGWPTDVDEDEMNDRWEALFGVDVPEDDPDFDGLANRDEFAAGTDPTLADSDADGLLDGADPNPTERDAEVEAPEPLWIDDYFPPLGAKVRASFPSGDAETTWVVYGPDGATARVQSGEPTLEFVVDAAGPWRVALTAALPGNRRYTEEVTVYGRRVVQVPEGADIQAAIDAAEPGVVLELQGEVEAESLFIDQDLVLSHERGAALGSLRQSSVNGAFITVADARLRVQGLTLRPGAVADGVAVQGGALELRRAQILGGETAIIATDSVVEADSVAILGATQVADGSASTLRLRNAVIGYNGEQDRPIRLTERSALELRSSVFCAGFGEDPDIDTTSTVAIAYTLLPCAALDDLDPASLLFARQADPEFVIDPAAAGDPDLRLRDGSPAIDAGDPDSPDADGSRGDIGVFGGPFGDWPEVDNDLDGSTNLDGDCDDLDPEIGLPRRDRDCEDARGCASAPGSPGGFVLAALALRRRSRGAR